MIGDADVVVVSVVSWIQSAEARANRFTNDPIQSAGGSSSQILNFYIYPKAAVHFLDNFQLSPSSRFIKTHACLHDSPSCATSDRRIRSLTR